MSEPLDVIIIGAGSAGLSALREVKKRTERYAIINAGPWGTICARVGCMPSKALIAAANAFHARSDLLELGIHGGDRLSIDLPAVLQRVRTLRDDFVKGNLGTTEQAGDRAISGRAKLLGVDRVSVNGKELRARKIIVAPGASPIVPAAWRDLDDRLMTTDSLFEQLTLPRRIAVVGQGPLGIELAQALRRLGRDVVGFGNLPLVAGLSDRDVSSVALELLRRELPIHLGHDAKLTSDGAAVRVEAGPNNTTVDRVLVALGRRPNVDGLGLDALGVPLDEDGLPKVNPQTMQVGDLPVFLVGEANGETSVLHEAIDDGQIAGLNAMAESVAHFRRRTSMAIVFSEPNVAMIGKRFSALKDPLIGEVRFDDQGRARIAQRNNGILRVYAERSTGVVLGAELCAPGGEHLAHLLALAIDRGLTAAQLLRMPYYHPTFEEGLRAALRQISGQITPATPSELGFVAAQ